MNLQNINFQPGLSAIFLNPFYIARKALFNSVRALAPSLKGKLLDVGCGSKPYRNLFTVDEYIGMEIESTQYKETKTDIDVFYDGNTFPFPDSTFDSILCNQVLEHVFNPEHFLNEIQRVLKPGGQILLTVPFVWDEHEQPWDYARYSSFALKHLFEQHGFEMLQQIKTVNNVGVIYQLINGYLYKKTKWNRFLRIFTTVFIMPGFTLSGLILGAILPSNNDLYLDNVILARKR
jgi:SAM-dependent methyltransferase